MAKVSLADNLKVIENSPLFQVLSPNQVHQLLDAGTILTYERGRRPLWEGDKSTDMFIFLAGDLAARKTQGSWRP